MSRSLFISRDLSATSAFSALKEEWLIVDQSLLEFTTIPFRQPAAFDWIFFYSQRGVIHYFDQASADTLDGKKVAAFGPKTAQALTEFYARIHFIGTGYAHASAPAFKMIAGGAQVLFPRAKRSLQSMQRALSLSIRAIDLIVYDNSPKTIIEIPRCDVLIFTSPLNAKTYFHHYNINEQQQIIAIGHTTAATLKELGVPKVLVPDQPNEQSMVALINKIQIDG